MFQAGRAVLTPQQAAAVIPLNWPSFQQRGIAFRRGALSLIAGPPGSGKSSLALQAAVDSGVPTLYLSADTTRHTVYKRLLAMFTGIPQNEAEGMMDADREWASQVLSQARNIWLDDDSSPTLEKIDLLIEAFREANGIEPELIIIDNAGDVLVDGQDEWGALRTLMRDLRHYARETGAAVVALHHTRLGAGNPAPPHDSIQGKINAVPELILTLTADSNPGFLGVSPVKHRHGSPDPYGSDPVWMEFNAAASQITDLMGVPRDESV